MNLLNLLILALIICFCPFSATADLITLTDTAGNSVEAQLVEVTPEEVKLSTNGRFMTVKMEQLAAESQAAAKEQAMRQGVFRSFPPVDIQVLVGTKRRQVPGSTYMKTMTISPSMKIKGSRMDQIPEADTTMIIVTMDTREKYAGSRGNALLAYKVFQQNIPAALSGAEREFDYPSFTLSYDADRDYTNIGGQRYKYYIFGMVDPSTGGIVHFETNHVQLAQHLERHPEERMSFLELKEGALVPAEFELE
jgi:hypothetical protein